jgi:K+-sensing histidine kinase KdpD
VDALRAEAQARPFEIEGGPRGVPFRVEDRLWHRAGAPGPHLRALLYHQGTGLGLAIIYGVLTRHGAEIRVRSELGRGACFEVELPVEFSPPDDAGEASSGL